VHVIAMDETGSTAFVLVEVVSQFLGRNVRYFLGRIDGAILVTYFNLFN
jgi:hypothetical protein